MVISVKDLCVEVALRRWAVHCYTIRIHWGTNSLYTYDQGVGPRFLKFITYGSMVLLMKCLDIWFSKDNKGAKIVRIQLSAKEIFILGFRCP